MDMLDGETGVTDYALERLTMLSDGIFAIAMTLLALELRPTDPWEHTLPGLLHNLAGPFQAFFWSFFSTASFWLSHRRMFGAYRRADTVISLLNLVLLGEITLIPVATRVLTELLFSVDAFALYLGLFGLIGLTNAATWVYAAGFTNIVRTSPGRGAIISVALILATLPVGMTALGVLANMPGLHWLPAMMPALALAGFGMRRAGAAYDRAYGGARSAQGLPGAGEPA